MQLTNCLLRLSPLVLPCHIGLACAQITTPSAGTYVRKGGGGDLVRSEEHTSELQSHLNLVCRLLLEKKKKIRSTIRQLIKLSCPSVLPMAAPLQICVQTAQPTF